MTVKMIVATDSFWGIGKDNKLPWDIPEDLQYFKEQTVGCTVVMGRKTYESLPFEGGLPHRFNVVVSGSWDYEHGNIQTMGLESLVGGLTNPKWVDGDSFWIIGGASIYKQLLPYVEEIHHTLVYGEYECDTFFDMSFLQEGGWRLVESKLLCDKATVNVWRKYG